MLTTALVPVLNQINLVHSLPSHFLKIHYNIILPSTLMSYKWALSLHAFHMAVSVAVSWLYLPNTVSWAVQSTLLVIMRHFLPLGSKYLPQHSIIERSWPTSSINVTDHLEGYITTVPRQLAPHSLQGQRYQDSRLKVWLQCRWQQSGLPFWPLSMSSKCLLKVKIFWNMRLCSLVCSFSCFK